MYKDEPEVNGLKYNPDSVALSYSTDFTDRDEDDWYKVSLFKMPVNLILYAFAGIRTDCMEFTPTKSNLSDTGLLNLSKNWYHVLTYSLELLNNVVSTLVVRFFIFRCTFKFSFVNNPVLYIPEITTGAGSIIADVSE